MGSRDGGDAGEAQEESGCSFVERSDSSLEEYSESDFSLDRFNFNETVNGGVVSEVFMLNQMGKRLQEYLRNESDNFIGSFPHSVQPKQIIVYFSSLNRSDQIIVNYVTTKQGLGFRTTGFEGLLVLDVNIPSGIFSTNSQKREITELKRLLGFGG